MAQHDYVIANGTGSAVRSDLNDALAAIVSMNSGSTEPSTTFAFQFWADTNANLLKMRNSANDGWIELRQLDGEFTSVSVANGTAAAPSIFFNASGTDTGIYSNGTDSVDVSTGGTRRLDIGSAGDVTVRGGNVTLNAQGDLRLADSDSSNWVAFQAPATVASNVTWTLPSADGTSGQALSTNGSGTLSWSSVGGDKIEEGNTSAEVVDTGSDGHFKVVTEGTEAVRVDAGQRLLVGTNSARSNVVDGDGGNTLTPQFQFETANNDAAKGLSVIYGRNNTNGAEIVLGKHRAATVGGNTIVSSGDQLGSLTFSGSDGTNFRPAATVAAFVDNTPGASDMPGRLVFSTTADGASSPTERMRIDSSGRLLVGTSSARTNAPGGTEGLLLEGTSSTNSQNRFAQFFYGEAGAAGPYIGLAKHRSTSIGGNTIVNNGDELGGIYFQGADGSDFRQGASISASVDGTPGVSDMPGRLMFSTTADGAIFPTERMRIRNNGNLRINLADFTASVSGSNTGVEFASGSFPVFRISSGDATSNNVAEFYNTNGQVGSISTSGSGTSYNTSSDYRLKENVVSLTGAADRLNQLQVYRFNFIADPDTTVDGFLAHEAQAVVPECVTGSKDAVEVWKEGEDLPDGVSVGDNKLDEDGNTIPSYQGIDQSKLVPLLTAALQEALAKIETLETRLTALEGA